jgi:hypothetical protein
VQVASIKTQVESAPGVCNQRLKLKCDEPLSNFAFNFNVRRYTSGLFNAGKYHGAATVGDFVYFAPYGQTNIGRAVQVDSIKTRVESAYGFSA